MATEFCDAGVFSVWWALSSISWLRPDGPVTITEAGLGATWRTRRRSSTMAWLSPTIRLSALAAPAAVGWKATDIWLGAHRAEAQEAANKSRTPHHGYSV